MTSTSHSKNRLALALAALGVVYGDIGTSPLYAVRQCFMPESGSLQPDHHDVLGVLSLIFWALTLIVVVKYLTVVLRADNRGEGGILALLALVTGDDSGPSTRRTILTVLGIFGTTLLLADGMITPAISVLSAVEGIEVAGPHLGEVVVPVTVVILIGLFLAQRYGTARIAIVFGPLMLGWFAMIAALGLPWIVKHPEILAACDPRRAVGMFLVMPTKTFLLLGAVVLCVTGAEALYADLGHFGRRPIRLAWFAVAYPCLLLNYFGQGAYILAKGDGIMFTNKFGKPDVRLIFFDMVPEVLLIPVLALATIATVIASQALISGAYSLAVQAVRLGFSPRLHVIHTSGEMKGQIYVPFVNWSLMIACIVLVLVFKQSSNLADAYGIAVISTMVITSVLLFQVMRTCWHWSLPASLALLGLFLAVDLPFLISNLNKVVTGGWIPLAVGAVLFTILMTWYRGQRVLHEILDAEAERQPLQDFVKHLDELKPNRVPGTVIFLTGSTDTIAPEFQELVERMHAMASRLIVVTIRTRAVPYVGDDDAVTIHDFGNGCFSVLARRGFMQPVSMPHFFDVCRIHGLDVDPGEVIFYLSRITLMTTGTSRMPAWQKAIFSFMYRNARPITSYYHLPPSRVVELGRLIEI